MVKTGAWNLTPPLPNNPLSSPDWRFPTRRVGRPQVCASLPATDVIAEVMLLMLCFGYNTILT